MSNIPFEIFISLYDYAPFIYPVNKETYSYITKKRNNKATIIQRWYKKYKIEEKMPMLFLSEMPGFPKWYIIRLYMKFYPKDDLKDWPSYYCKRKQYLETRQHFNPLPFSEFNYYDKDLMNLSAFEVFNFMKSISKEDIISTGF